jgi:uncharacterized protein with von Willebrand factor type A (vWA) domain
MAVLAWSAVGAEILSTTSSRQLQAASSPSVAPRPCIDDLLPSHALCSDRIIDTMRTSMLRTTGTVAAALRSSVRSTQTRRAHAISNPTLANIEKRWEVMPPQEQADLWMALRDRMKVDWTQMTLQEKKAGMSTFCHNARTRPIGEPSYV